MSIIKGVDDDTTGRGRTGGGRGGRRQRGATRAGEKTKTTPPPPASAAASSDSEPAILFTFRIKEDVVTVVNTQSSCSPYFPMFVSPRTSWARSSSSSSNGTSTYKDAVNLGGGEIFPGVVWGRVGGGKCGGRGEASSHRIRRRSKKGREESYSSDSLYKSNLGEKQ